MLGELMVVMPVLGRVAGLRWVGIFIFNGGYLGGRICVVGMVIIIEVGGGCGCWGQ